VHDLSDGGLAIGLAEMAMASGIGATVNQLEGGDPIPQFFGEDQARYLVTVRRDFLDQFFDEIYPYAGVFAPWIGNTGGTALKLGNARAIPVAQLKAAHEGWFPAFMAGELAA
jgi:phosphoribosylformylglycinamidine synthase subunit PurL